MPVTSKYVRRWVDLFGKVHRNDDDVTVACQAYQCLISMPPKSGFLLSDIARLGPLLKGVDVTSVFARRKAERQMPRSRGSLDWYWSIRRGRTRVFTGNILIAAFQTGNSIAFLSHSYWTPLIPYPSLSPRIDAHIYWMFRSALYVSG